MKLNVLRLQADVRPSFAICGMNRLCNCAVAILYQYRTYSFYLVFVVS